MPKVLNKPLLKDGYKFIQPGENLLETSFLTAGEFLNIFTKTDTIEAYLLNYTICTGSDNCRHISKKLSAIFDHAVIRKSILHAGACQAFRANRNVQRLHLKMIGSRNLAEIEGLKSAIIDVSKSSGVLTPFTALVGKELDLWAANSAAEVSGNLILDNTQIRGYSVCHDVIDDSRLGFDQNKPSPRKFLKTAGIFSKNHTEYSPLNPLVIKSQPDQFELCSKQFAEILKSWKTNSNQQKISQEMSDFLKVIENMLCDSDDSIHKLELENIYSSWIENPKIQVYVDIILSKFNEFCEAAKTSEPWCERIENMSSFDVLY